MTTPSTQLIYQMESYTFDNTGEGIPLAVKRQVVAIFIVQIP